jgi:hypothetical protein
MIDPTVSTAVLMTIVIGIGLVFAGGIASIIYAGLSRRRAATPTADHAPAGAAGRATVPGTAARSHRETQPA